MSSNCGQLFMLFSITLLLSQVNCRLPPAMGANPNIVNMILSPKDANNVNENFEFCSIDVLKQFLSVEGLSAILTVVARIEGISPLHILQTLAVLQGIHEKDRGHPGSNFLSPVFPRSPNLGLKKHYNSLRNKYGGQDSQDDEAEVKYNRLQTRFRGDSEVFESEPEALQQDSGTQYIKSENKFYPVGIEYEEPQARHYDNDVTKFANFISNSNLKTPGYVETPNGLPKALLVLLNSEDDVIVHRWVDLAPKTSFLDLIRLARDEGVFTGLQSADNSFVFKLKKNNLKRCLAIEFLGPLKSTPSNSLIIRVYTSSLKVVWNDSCLPKVADLLIYSGYVVTISKGQSKFMS